MTLLYPARSVLPNLVLIFFSMVLILSLTENPDLDLDFFLDFSDFLSRESTPHAEFRMGSTTSTLSGLNFMADRSSQKLRDL